MSDLMQHKPRANDPAPATAGAEEPAAAVTGRRIPIGRLRDFALVPAILAIAILGEIVSPVFLHYDNILNVLQTMSEIGLLVLAESLILLTGRMDLRLSPRSAWPPGSRHG